MSTTSTEARPRKRRSVGLGISMIIVAVVAVMIGKAAESSSSWNFSFSRGGSTTPVSAVIGSEKRPYFEDERVRSRLAELGYEVNVRTAGSRDIALGTDLTNVDFVFPSSEPAGEKIAADNDFTGVYTPFYSPMTVATFEPIVGMLAEAGAVHSGGHYLTLDMGRYLEIAESGTRWHDLGDAFPSPRVVQISTTDITSSNSAAMYLSILATVVAGGVPTMADSDEIVRRVTPQFAGQGYTSASSAGPFSDYLSQGMGSKPMVMVYEAQFLGEAMKDNSRIRDDMVLLYPSPTVQSSHTVVALTTAGNDVGRLLRDDAELQRLAAEHGFRTQDPAAFEQVIADHGVHAPHVIPHTAATPSYHVLEHLIESVSANLSGAPQP